MNLFSMSNCKSVSFGKICKQKRPFMRTAAVLLAMCITAGSVMGCGALSTQSSGAETEQASAPSPDAGQADLSSKDAGQNDADSDEAGQGSVESADAGQTNSDPSAAGQTNAVSADAVQGSTESAAAGLSDAVSAADTSASSGSTLLTLPYEESDPAQSASAYPWICSDLVENVRKLDGLTETDDFHAAVNHDWLTTKTIPSGYVSYDTFSERQLEVDSELQTILESDQEFSDPYIAHSQKLVQDYYQMWLDWDARDAAGVEPFRDVVAPLLAVNSIEDMTKYLSEPDTFIRALPLCGVFTAANPNDADNNAVYITPPSLVFQDPMYYDYLGADSWRTQPRYMYAAGYMLTRLGYSDQERDQILKDSYAFECKMAASMMTTAESKAEDSSIRRNNPRTLQELEKEQGSFPLTGMLSAAGVEHSNVFILEEPEWLACMSGLFDEEHLDQMKAYLLVSDALQFMELLDHDCYNRMIDVRNMLSGSSGQVDDKKAATDAVNEVLELELGDVYAETYITDKTRTDVTALINDVVEYYRSMLQNAEFLSDSTRAEAIKKLDNLTIRVASPEDYEEEDKALEAAEKAGQTDVQASQTGNTSVDSLTDGSAEGAAAADGAAADAGDAVGAAADAEDAEDAAAADSTEIAAEDAGADVTTAAADSTAADAAAAAAENTAADSTAAAAENTAAGSTAAAADTAQSESAERILDFKGPDEGGTLVDARIAISEDTCLSIAEEVNQPVDREAWIAASQDVNAYYYPLDNSINIPAGILGGSFYNDRMSYEEKLAHVGVIAAHEISHAFDTSGRQYDEHGNLRNWWTEEDYLEFHERAQKLVDYYNGFEPVPGYPLNGAMIDTEAIADLTGVKCMLRIAADHKDFNYDLFFRSFAANWRNLTTLETEAYSIEQDSHPLAYLRTNAVVVQFEEFHKTYGTKEGDGMYLAPEYRLEIW